MPSHRARADECVNTTVMDDLSTGDAPGHSIRPRVTARVVNETGHDTRRFNAIHTQRPQKQSSYGGVGG